jgi:hypothetical protein
MGKTVAHICNKFIHYSKSDLILNVTAVWISLRVMQSTEFVG